MSTVLKTNKKALGAGVLAAFPASLCCITPILALVAGIGGVASTFSWLEPLRPYLMGSSLLALGVAWYQKLPRKKEADCECETEPKRSFFHSKSFLGIVTVFAILMLAFPYYAGALYTSSADNHTSIYVNPEPAAFKLTIDGMTCTGCEITIEQTALSQPGVSYANADFKTGKATILADTSRASIDEIREKIEETGYAVRGAKSTQRQDVRHPPAVDHETKEKK